jgi:hypothetical protein
MVHHIVGTIGIVTLEQAINEALDVEPRSARDKATAELALTYARSIDGEGDLTKLGPALLACLESLLMSPRARAAAKKAVTTSEPAANPLDQLAARRAGKDRAAPVDAAATGPQ